MSTANSATIRGRARSVLKGVYYSWTFRAVAYAPLDAFDRISGRRDPLTPPRRLQYVGRAADFEAVGAELARPARPRPRAAAGLRRPRHRLRHRPDRCRPGPGPASRAPTTASTSSPSSFAGAAGRSPPVIRTSASGSPTSATASTTGTAAGPRPSTSFPTARPASTSPSPPRSSPTWSRTASAATCRRRSACCGPAARSSARSSSSTKKSSGCSPRIGRRSGSTTSSPTPRARSTWRRTPACRSSASAILEQQLLPMIAEVGFEPEPEIVRGWWSGRVGRAGAPLSGPADPAEAGLSAGRRGV